MSLARSLEVTQLYTPLLWLPFCSLIYRHANGCLSIILQETVWLTLQRISLSQHFYVSSQALLSSRFMEALHNRALQKDTFILAHMLASWHLQSSIALAWTSPIDNCNGKLIGCWLELVVLWTLDCISGVWSGFAWVLTHVVGCWHRLGGSGIGDVVRRGRPVYTIATLCAMGRVSPLSQARPASCRSRQLAVDSRAVVRRYPYSSLAYDVGRLEQECTELRARFTSRGHSVADRCCPSHNHTCAPVRKASSQECRKEQWTRDVRPFVITNVMRTAAHPRAALTRCNVQSTTYVPTA